MLIERQKEGLVLKAQQDQPNATGFHCLLTLGRVEGLREASTALTF